MIESVEAEQREEPEPGLPYIVVGSSPSEKEDQASELIALGMTPARARALAGLPPEDGENKPGGKSK